MYPGTCNRLFWEIHKASLFGTFPPIFEEGHPVQSIAPNMIGIITDIKTVPTFPDERWNFEESLGTLLLSLSRTARYTYHKAVRTATPISVMTKIFS